MWICTHCIPIRIICEQSIYSHLSIILINGWKMSLSSCTILFLCLDFGLDQLHLESQLCPECKSLDSWHLSTTGCWKGIVPLEQWSHREFNQTEPESYTAYYLSCFGEKWTKPLESGGKELDSQCSKDILWYWSTAFWGMFTQVWGEWSKSRRDQSQTRSQMEAFGRDCC